MKTIVLKLFAVSILVAVIGGICDFKNDTFLLEENVEALAQTEHGEYIRCYDTITSDPTDNVRYCGTCQDIPGRWKSGMNFCRP